MQIRWLHSALGRKAGQVEDVDESPKGTVAIGRKLRPSTEALPEFFAAGLAEPAAKDATLAAPLKDALRRRDQAEKVRQQKRPDTPEAQAALEKELAAIAAGKTEG